MYTLGSQIKSVVSMHVSNPKWTICQGKGREKQKPAAYLMAFTFLNMPETNFMPSCCNVYQGG